jgi:hypothetical protein
VGDWGHGLLPLAAKLCPLCRQGLMRLYHDEFRNLHNLIMKMNGHYPGMLIVRRDNDPKRHLSPRGL